MKTTTKAAGARKTVGGKPAAAKSATTKPATTKKPVAKAASKPQPKAAAKPAKTAKPKAATKPAPKAAAKKPVAHAAKAAPRPAAKPAPVAPKAKSPAPAPAAKIVAKPAPAAAAPKPAVAPTPVVAPPAAALPHPATFPIPAETRPLVAREVSPAFAGLVPSPAMGSFPNRPPFLGGPRPGAQPLRMQPAAGPIAAPAAAKAEPIEFAEGDHVVYPTHGVGKVMGIVNEEIAGHKLQLIVVTFDENRMTLRVPVAKARSSGLRKLASRKMIDTALTTLKGRARIKRTMWSRRAQEYEAKINSGDPIAIAEVVRDLHRNAGQPDQSFSERQIYEAALDRLASEIAAIDGTDKVAASEKLAGVLKTA